MERPVDNAIAYRGAAYSAAAFERQFNPRAVIENMDAVLRRRQELAAETLARLPHSPDIPYGPSPRQTMLIFPAGLAGDPTNETRCADLLFFHGGYWRAGHGSENCFVAEAFTAAGGTVLMASYDLCPRVGIGDIVRQAKDALVWTVANAADHGIDPATLWIGGHSAGAHLCAMILADPDMPPVAGAMLVSGIFDIEPVLNISVNAEIQATAAEIDPWSPLKHPPARPTDMIVSVGGDESAEWQRQSRLYADIARAAGCDVTRVTEAGEHHLSILFNLRRPQSPTAAATIDRMTRRS